MIIVRKETSDISSKEGGPSDTSDISSRTGGSGDNTLFSDHNMLFPSTTTKKILFELRRREE